MNVTAKSVQKIEPEITFTMNDKTYTMLGKVKVLKALEKYFNCSIGETLERCMTLQIHEVGTIILEGIVGGGGEATLDEVEEGLIEMGYGEAKWLAFEFITLSLTPPRKRSETIKKLRKVKETLS